MIYIDRNLEMVTWCDSFLVFWIFIIDYFYIHKTVDRSILGYMHYIIFEAVVARLNV